MNQILYGVPASITLSQAALESGWSKSSLAADHNNFFGIKSHGWGGATVSVNTQEFVSGQYVTVQDEFRSYPTALGSFKDHANFLRDNSNYKPLFELSKTDYKGWAQGLKSAGYATSPTYDHKLISIIEKYGMSRYDYIAQFVKFALIATATIILAIIIKKFVVPKLTK